MSCYVNPFSETDMHTCKSIFVRFLAKAKLHVLFARSFPLSPFQATPSFFFFPFYEHTFSIYFWSASAWVGAEIASSNITAIDCNNFRQPMIATVSLSSRTFSIARKRHHLMAPRRNMYAFFSFLPFSPCSRYNKNGRKSEVTSLL